MKTIGLIGGMSWESSAEYYRIINEEVKQLLGGLHSAKCILYSVDFDEIEKLQDTGMWDEAGMILGEAASRLEKAGADLILICTNTMHKVYDSVQTKTRLPILHIADETTREISRHGISKVGLLGTRYTMEQDFYLQRIKEAGMDVVIPDEEDRTRINEIIFMELCVGRYEASSIEYLRKVIGNLIKKGVQGIILGCTEIGLIIKQEDSVVPLFDTTMIHAKSSVHRALNINNE